MRHSEFWFRMEHHLGDGYARSWADDQVLRELDGRTPTQALSDGDSPKSVWRAVWAVLGLPAADR